MLLIPLSLFFTKHELKSLFGTRLRVVFNELVQTSKYYMRDVTAVESSWLVELAPHFYKQAKVRATRTPALSCRCHAEDPERDPIA